MGLAGAGQLGVVFHGFQHLDGVDQFLDRIGGVVRQGVGQGGVQRGGVSQHRLGPGVRGQEGRHLPVAAQRNAGFGQSRSRFGGKAGAVHEQHGVLAAHIAERQGVGGVVHIGGAQVQKPGHAVQLGHQRGGAAPGGQLAAQNLQLLGRGAAGVLLAQQPGRGGGQGGPALHPHFVLQMQRAQLGAQPGGQVGQLAAALDGHGLGAVAQHRTLLQHIGEILLHLGHALYAGVHRGNAGASQGRVGRTEKPAVHPQGGGVRRDHQGGVFAREAGKILPAGVMGGGVLAGMGVAAGHQIRAAPGGSHGRAQGGQAFRNGLHDKFPRFSQARLRCLGGRRAAAWL